MTVRILTGDCRDVLPTLADESVQCVVTSPPYWGLRDYGTASWIGGDPNCEHLAPLPGGTTNSRLGDYANGMTDATIHANVAARRQQFRTRCRRCGAERVDRQIGLEDTPEEYLTTMVGIFREVRRVLRRDGTLWLNMGDCYASDGGRGAGGNQGRLHRAYQQENPRAGRARPSDVIKPKDLVGMPWMLAFALRADGWFLRRDHIWSKPNPMPESVRDRCTTAHEYIFMLTKSGRPTIWRAKDTLEWSTTPDLKQRLPGRKPGTTVRRWREFDYYFDAEAIKEEASENTHPRVGGTGVGFGHGFDANTKPRYRHPAGWESGEGRNHRALQGRYNGVGPKSVARGAQDLRTSDAFGRGAGWRNKQNSSFQEATSGDVLQWRNKRSVWEIPTSPFKGAHFATFPPALAEICIKAGSPRGGVVLDPFGGSGTVGLVADRLQRDAVLLELSPTYAAMARRRITDEAPLLVEATHG